MRHFILLIVAVFFFRIGFSQDFSVSGYVKDSSSGEALIGANVFIKELTRGTSANEYGFYSITVPKGSYTLVVSYLGFQTVEYPLVLSNNIKKNINLPSNAIVNEEVVVTAQRSDKNVESAQMGTTQMDIAEVKKLPALLGEVDIMRTLQLLPGVMSAGEGNSGFYVRGGGPDQNLVLLDDAVVYNPGHLFGFFSVFNSDVIKNTTLIKGGVPANYGGRVSSVLDISMKDGNMKKWHAEGGLGIISSRLSVQGPIKKDKCSVIVSGRRTYADLIAKPILKNLEEGKYAGNGYYFYDINAKINYRFSDKDRLYLSGYFGRDVFTFTDQAGTFKIKLPWGNTTSTLRWNHLFSDKIFMNTSFVYNDYQFQADADFAGINLKLQSGVRDFNAKADIDFFPNILNKVKFGFNYTYHIFTPSIVSGQAGDVSFESSQDKRKYAHEYALYMQDETDLTHWLKINAGVRLSGFSQVGPLNKLYQNPGGIDTVSYKRNEHIVTYGGIEPRLNARLRINKNSSIKMGATLSRQYMHLVSSSTTTLPFDIWVPSSKRVKPQTVTQYSVGYFHNFKEDMFETSVELYYKDMYNQIEYSESFVNDIDQDIEEQFTFGKGQAYGAEFFLKKAKGKFTGWIGYTLSYTWRKFPDLNEGKKFPAKYDRRHDLSIVLSYEITKRLTLATTYVYGTGQATTVPVGRYFIEGNIVNQYGERNGYRLAAYHRWDLSLTYVIKDKKWYNDINFSIYNVYSRKNPYFIYYDVTGSPQTGDVKVGAKQVSLFPIIPALTWNFKI